MPRLKPATPRSKQQIDDALKLMGSVPVGGEMTP